MRQIVYAILTRAPVVSEVQALPVTPRLACIRPAASVHPEPGSNSSLLNFKYYLTTKEIKFYLLMMVYSLKNICKMFCTSQKDTIFARAMKQNAIVYG